MHSKKKLLIAPRQPNASQWHIIFKTKCTIRGKVCNLLINSGHTKIFVSIYLLKALNLIITKHMQLYKISWVSKGIKILVVEMCRVTFSIGKHFICEVLCNILDMDVCHLILRRSCGLMLEQFMTADLPPLREIQYQIDFILGMNLPNLPHYRISFLEYITLQEIVDDLLSSWSNIAIAHVRCRYY